MTTLLPDVDGVSFGMYDHFLPGVKTAVYTLHIEAQMKSRETGEIFHQETNDFEFVVGSPRFSLVAQDEIRSCSPPRGGNADYRYILPHIVLDKRALPWERPLDPNASTTADRAIPWLALVLLTNDELAADGAHLTEMTIAEMIQGPDDILGPGIDVQPHEVAQTVTILDASVKLFRAVCPRIEELPLLAHVRRIGMENKLDATAPNERDFAILTTNRFVQRGSNVVLLVSLEGWRWWLENDDTDADDTRVQVIVLHSWNFMSDAGDGSFAGHIKKLDVASFQDRSAVEATDDATLRAMFRQGYTAIAYAPDGALKTLAWYRGPLSPVRDAYFESNRVPFDSADAAIIIEENTGILDVSLSSAFQLGRLLALSSPSFGTALRHWNRTKQLDMMAQGASAPMGSLVEEMARYVASHVLESEASDPGLADVKVVSEWLVQARMLEAIPLRYLVPSANHLPMESLRLFYLDENWLDAFTDGALSLGAASSRTLWFYQSNRGTLRQTLRALMMMQKKSAQSSLSGAVDERMPMCGFLLRSALFDRFPGLEVECADAQDSPRTLPILRREMLSRGLLLVVVMGEPAQIRFKLPRESLTFSHDARGLRPRVTAANEKNLGARAPNTPPIVIRDYMRRDSQHEGVLDVRKLHDKLEGPNDSSGARFALHWLNGPDDVTVQWEHDTHGDRP